MPAATDTTKHENGRNGRFANRPYGRLAGGYFQGNDGLGGMSCDLRRSLGESVTVVGMTRFGMGTLEFVSASA